MKRNLIITIIVSLIILLLTTILMVSLAAKQEEDNTIPQNYIAVFKNETGETVYSTYLYKKKKKYKYINTISQSYGYDSVSWQEKVLEKGKLKKKKDIFKKAEKNNADSYVKYKKDDKVYTIDEFKDIWK